MTDFKELFFGELVEIHNEQIDPKKLKGKQVRHFSIPNFDEKSKALLEDADQISSKKFTVPSDSILISKLNPRIKRVWRPQVKENEISIASTEFIVLKPKNNINRDYLYYLLCTEDIYVSLRSLATGTSSSHQRFKPKELLNLKVKVPNMTVQKNISTILNMIERKININLSINEKLNHVSSLVFKDLFVTYDFFKRNKKDFKVTESGEMPKDFVGTKISEIIENKTVKVGKKNPTIYSVLNNMSLVPSDQNFNKKVYSEKISTYKIVEKFDFAYNPYRINIGSIAMLEEERLGAVSPAYTVFKPKNNYQWFMYYFIREKNTREMINTYSIGSVRQSLSFNNFCKMDFGIPPIEYASYFNDLITEFKEKIYHNEKQNKKLNEIKEFLLLKLLSGETLLY